MATATSTITPSLTPSQEAAREFWRQAGADGMPPFYVMSQYYAQLSANSDNLPAVTAALEQLLTGLGYATDVDTVFAELTAGQGEELGYWAGRYCLFDSDGNRFDLVVGRDGATLTVPPALIDMTSLPAGTDIASVTVLNSVGFSDGMLQLANANALLPRNIALLRLQASLSFSLPVSDATLDGGAVQGDVRRVGRRLCRVAAGQRQARRLDPGRGQPDRRWRPERGVVWAIRPARPDRRHGGEARPEPGLHLQRPHPKRPRPAHRWSDLPVGAER